MSKALAVLLLVLVAGCVKPDENQTITPISPQSGPSAPFCGDGNCTQTENSCTCPSDCGACEQSFGCLQYVCKNSTCIQERITPCCGNRVCESGETSSSCPNDCRPTTAFCFNFICEPGETSDACCTDCGCPNGKSCVNNKCIQCGDDICDTSESWQTCCTDCGCYSPMTTCKNNQCVDIGDRIFVDMGDGGDVLERSYPLSYHNKKLTLVLSLSTQIYQTYQGRSDRFSKDYDLFASDPFDDKYISRLAGAFLDLSGRMGRSVDDVSVLVTAWIQSLPYTSDNVTTAFDEYPRFPYETIYDDGGDCEDTSILTSALLQEMGYKTVLVEYPGHMALGLECEEDHKGTKYNHNGTWYCYLETTGSGWELGVLPREYASLQPKIIPVEKRPYLKLSFVGVERRSPDRSYISVNVTVRNIGSQTVFNTKVFVGVQGMDLVFFNSTESEPFGLEPDKSFVYRVPELSTQTGLPLRILTRVTGDEATPLESASAWVD